MSRSYKKTIAWGKSTSSKANRNGRYGRLKAHADKARKEGRPFTKSHTRSEVQTQEDYIEMVRQGINSTSPLSDYFRRRYGTQWDAFLDGREPTEKLIREFGIKLYKKDRSR